MSYDKELGTRNVASSFTCGICNKLTKEHTTVMDCLHTFCKKCIYKKLFEEKIGKCPVCNVELKGSNPDLLLRTNHKLSSLKVRIFAVHKRTPEQRVERKRIKFEEMQARRKDKGKQQMFPPPDDQGKESPASKKDKGKEKVNEKPLDKSQSFKIPYKDKGKEKVIDQPLIESWEDLQYDFLEPFPMTSRPKGVVIRSASSPPPPPPPPPPPGRKNRRICLQNIIDNGKNINPAKKTRYAWFILAPSAEQNRKKPLNRLSEPNLKLKFDSNSNPTVSTLMKYVAMQLKLGSEEKVGIFMFGSLLSPEMKLVDVEDEWMAIVGSERERTYVGSSALHFCIKLTYASTD